MASDRTTSLTGWRRFIRPGATDFQGYEWLLMRILFVIVAWRTFDARMLSETTAIPKPHGLAQFVDLTWMLDAQMQTILFAIALVHLGFYLFNVLPLWSCSALLVIHTLLGTIVNSQGAIHHTSQIVGFVLIGHVVGYLALVIQRRTAVAFGWKQFELPNRLLSPAPKLVIYLTQQMIAVTYVVSAISKIVRSEGKWVSSLPNISLQLQKTRMMAHYNTLEPVPELAGWAITMVREFPGVAMVFFGLGLALELFAFVALFNRAFMALFGISLMLMHISISQVMNLGFFYNKWLLLVFWINVPYWLVMLVRYRKTTPTEVKP